MINTNTTNQPSPGQWPWPHPSPPTPAGPSGNVDFSYNPQDKVVLTPEKVSLNIKAGDNGPETDKIKMGVKLDPSKDGNYVFKDGDKGFHGANAFAAVAQTVAIFEKASGEPIKWAFTSPQLKVNADQGQMLNAFYSRRAESVNFFHANDNTSHQTVYSADSGEVVGHETGHAILDSKRPSYLGSWSPDPGGFHESFGDVIAMLATLQDDKSRAKVVEQTGGDLTRSNVASNLGEELGIAINHSVGHDVTGGDFTRTAINKFKWQDPSTLPDSGGPDQLGKEAHSYSRLWTGAMYDVLTAIVKDNLAAGQSADAALKNGSDEGLKMYGQLMKTAPRGDFAYKDMAVAMLQADRDYNQGKHQDLLTSVFKERNILPASFSAADVPPPSRNLVEARDEDVMRTELVPLNGNYGKFNGCQVQTQVDSTNENYDSDEHANQVCANVGNLIKSGRILYTEPGQVVKQSDLFDKNGRPYMGVVSWLSGQPVIERTGIVD